MNDIYQLSATVIQVLLLLGALAGSHARLRERIASLEAKMDLLLAEWKRSNEHR